MGHTTWEESKGKKYLQKAHILGPWSQGFQKIVDRGESAEFHNLGELFARCHIKSDPMVQRLTKLTDHKGN